jgi:hypothetical protein
VTAAIGAQATLIGAGIIGGVVTFAALLLPGMRDVETSRLPPRPAPQAPHADLAPAPPR